MWHLVIALALAGHGLGHAVGFWLPVPTWFAALWLLPGAAFLLAGWGCWERAGWWPAAAIGAAVASLAVLALQGGALRLTPYGSALAFDALALVALLAPWSRHLIQDA